MKKNTIISVVLSLIANVILPLLVVFIIGGLDAMGILLISLFLLNPIVSVVIGLLSGGEKVLWYLPILNAVIFLIAESVLLGFDVSNLIAAVVYAGLGLAAAYIKSAVIKKKQISAD